MPKTHLGFQIVAFGLSVTIPWSSRKSPAFILYIISSVFKSQGYIYCTQSVNLIDIICKHLSVWRCGMYVCSVERNRSKIRR